MLRTICGLIIVFLTGCFSSTEYKRPNWDGKPWDTAYLIDSEPESVTDLELDEKIAEVERHYRKYSEVLGQCWQPNRLSTESTDLDSYGTGGDTAIFTGFALAGMCYKYAVTNDRMDLVYIRRALSGIYLLTHTAGDGVIARCAFPSERKSEWRYPERWQSRVDRGFVGESDGFSNPLGGVYPSTIYYTRGTKDQLTGIILGLAVAWKLFPLENDIRSVIATIVRDLVSHLRKYNWYIVDANGKNDTNADHVAGLQKTQLLALYRHTSSITGGQDSVKQEYLDSYDVAGEWFGLFDNMHSAYAGAGDSFNLFANSSQYFAWNLRYARIYTIWLLAETEDEQSEAAQFINDWLWPHTRDHQNPWFTFTRAVITDRGNKVEEAILALKSLSLKPLRGWPSPYADQAQAPGVLSVLFRTTGRWVLPPHLRKPIQYWTWSKAPWDTGHLNKQGLKSDTGLSLLVPYWFGRYYNLIDRP